MHPRASLVAHLDGCPVCVGATSFRRTDTSGTAIAQVRVSFRCSDLCPAGAALLEEVEKEAASARTAIEAELAASEDGGSV